MSEKVIIRVDDESFFKLNNKLEEDESINEEVKESVEIKEQDTELISTLKENVLILEKQNKSLEIDNICLMQENKNLQTKIDDLVKMYPSAVALLGKTSEFDTIRKNKRFFKK
ncbi:hypothetical protein AYK24_05205 [Thermoplasmatales archaeon SG8-52-4]|nr:MAG: hypothetical protein AYK24_05205 [Thermoplasmatales archaeon SG8-52-4]